MYDYHVVFMEIEELQSWTCVNLMRFKKAKCKILHLDQCNPQCQYRLGDKGRRACGYWWMKSWT